MGPAPAYAVPDYVVPEYEVPAYGGPDLTAPQRSAPSGPGRQDTSWSQSGPPRQGAPEAPGDREMRGGAPGDAAAPPAAGPRHAAPRRQEPAPQQQPQQPQQPHGPTRGPLLGQPYGQPYAPPAPDPRRADDEDRWQRIVLGRPSARVEPKPPPADPYRPDTIFDGWSTPHLTVRLASVRGDAHRFGGSPRQDDVVVACHEPTGTVVFAVADGVSSAPLSHIGAALACRTAVNDLLVQLGERREELDWSRVLNAAAYQLLMRVAHGREPAEAEHAEATRTLATTLVTGTVAPAEGGILHVTLVRAGDSSAWCLRGREYTPLLDDEDPGSEEISSTAVVALPRLSARSRSISYKLPPDSVLLVGTDGFGVPLGDGTGLVGDLFATGLAVPPPEPRTLAHLLDFSRETFDDDRTLLAVWPRHRLPGGPR
ncbi:protein phosphatase 2C domain-containing protein [Streptomyces sp. RY43-2]|uniref:Protein phosphatase 2C domain-containing protein n=1 Tax=Streptomyces macrolidinus TaxID=2952607 RepID=A0ABT0ZEI9_9ACTN|nr:protein phosphatase 2C domain-containing protein [Streptomyces macrolidinus]MCN9241983.1 protein phosphatase 2C domain-containing protein [Streptomyces macrolidinus]